MHIAKYGKKGLGQLFSHYERKNNEQRNYSNESIDKTKTYLNYNLAPAHEEGNYKFTVDRCKSLNILNRSDVNYCCDWCLTVPQEIKEDEEKCKAFFKASYNFLVNRYREENVIGAYVHYDETTPHMHFSFIPVKYSFTTSFNADTGEISEVEKGKVSAKEVIDRKELKVIHSELQEYLNQNLDFECNVLNGATKSNETVKQLKEKSKLKEEINTLTKQRDNIQKHTSALLNYNITLKKEEEELAKVVSNLFESYTTAIDEDTIKSIDNRFLSIQQGFRKFDAELEKGLQNEHKLSKINVLENDDGIDFA